MARQNLPSDSEAESEDKAVRRGDSENGIDVTAILTELSKVGGIIPLLVPRLWGVAIPDDDPKLALPAIADKLANAHSLPPPRVLTCLQLLVAAEARGRSLTKAQLYRSFFRGLPSILSAALVRMSAEEAIKFCESEDLNAYHRRDRIAQVLASSYTPLLSLDELGRVLSEFVSHLESNRENLLATGHPATYFAANHWLDIHFNKLYFTKIPVTLGEQHHASTSPSRRPTYPGFCVDRRRIATRSTDIEPDWFDAMELIDRRHEDSAPVCRWQWAKSTDDTWTVCEYDEADILIGLSNEDAERLARLRPAILGTERRVFCNLAAAILRRDHHRLWEICLRDITDQLTAEDAEFLLRMDVFFAGYEVRITRSEMRTLPLLPGGLTNLIELIGHVKKELVIGTMAKTRNALADAIVLDGLRRPRFVTEINRSQWPRLMRLSKRHPFLDLVAVGMGDGVRAALDLCADLDSEEPAFWSSFRSDAERALSAEFDTLVGIHVRQRFRPVLEPALQQYANQLTQT